MKNLALASSVALAAMTGSAYAADMDRELGLIVSGVVDQWAGVQVINNGGGFSDDTVFASGSAGYLSLPLGTNLSIQSDFQVEYNDNAFDNNPAVLGPRYSYQGAGHLSYRDPSSFLLGAFGGMGTIKHNDFGGPFTYDYRFVGGEAQIYFNDLTFYLQGGYADIKAVDVVPADPDEAIFGRGVLRWFLDADSRLQLEGLYMNVDNVAGAAIDDYDVVSWGARYDTNVTMPIIGNTPLYAAYRGTNRSDCNDGADQTDHTFMVGTSYSFSGSKIEVDRSGATLDTPDLGNFFTCVNPDLVSDRRLKTDIAELGQTEDGIKLYSWRYKSDLVTTWVGVMAQDLETRHPEALVTGADGFYRVNYSKLGVRMMTLEQWNARQL